MTMWLCYCLCVTLSKSWFCFVVYQKIQFVGYCVVKWKENNLCSIGVNRTRASTLVQRVVFEKNTVDPSLSTRNCSFYKIFLRLNFYAGIVKNEQTIWKRFYHFKIETVDKFNIHLLNFFKEKLKIAIEKVSFFKPGMKRLGSPPWKN